MDEQIDANLRRVYSETLNEPLPDRFTELLGKLREKKSVQSKPSPEEDE